MAAISSTTHLAGPATAPSAAPEPATLARPTAPAIVRAFGVMVGGPLLLLATAAAAGLHALRAVPARRPPRPAALAVLGAAAAYGGPVRPWMGRWGAADLAGCRMRNADRIHPQWQDRRAGDTVLLHPSSGLKILRLDPGRAMVFEDGWALAIEPAGPARCRMLTRFRFPRGALSVAYALLLELPHFLMERKMLREIKRRAEAAR